MASGVEIWRELDDAARAFNHAAARGVTEMMRMPQAADVVPRLFEVATAVTSLVSDLHAAAEYELGELRGLVEVKSDFLRLTAHELRRPAGLITGQMSLIEGGSYGPVPEAMLPGLKVISACAQEFGHLIDGLNSIARLEDRAQALRREPRHLDRLIAESVEEIEAEASAKGMTIDQSAEGPNILADVDPDLLDVAVRNLLSNAVKYAPSGSRIRVAIGCPSATEGPTIAVSDEGPGIDADQAKRIFDRWYRSPTATQPGLGLGLYIVRVLIELHGGRIELNSALDRGSTFTLVLPR